jgi:hypothetical protein
MALGRTEDATRKMLNRCKGVALNMTYINAYVKLFSKNSTTIKYSK